MDQLMAGKLRLNGDIQFQEEISDSGEIVTVINNIIQNKEEKLL